MDITTIVIVVATFVLAGWVKGVIGLGLPTVSLAILTVALGMKEALVIMLLPSFITNVWQGLTGGKAIEILQRTRVFLLLSVLFVPVGALALKFVELFWLSALLGILLCSYATINLSGFGLQVKRHQEGWMGPLAGFWNGILAGMTGVSVMPGVVYMQALGMPRDMLIQAMGLFFTLTTVALAVAYYAYGLATYELGALSVIGVVPSLIGMHLGQKVRRKLSPGHFRKVFFGSLLVLGIVIVIRSFLEG